MPRVSLRPIKSLMQAPNQPYENYKMEPSAQNLGAVVESLTPTIDYGLRSVNSHDDPHMRNMARVYTARAVERYNPDSGASLNTWVSNQLQQLRRLRRNTQQVLKVPERHQIEGYKLSVAEREFEDEHGRDPDSIELADYTGVPISRIKKIRETSRRVGIDSDGYESPAQSETDFMQESMEYVHGESDHLDRMILEHRLGFGGKEILEGEALGAKLGLEPYQLSRRASRITKKLLDMERDLKQVNS